MKFKLNAKDRLIIPNLLPPEGTMLEQTVVKEIIDKVRLHSKEFSKYGVISNVCLHCQRPITNLEGLDPETNPKILIEDEFDLNKIQTDAMKDAVKKKDDDKKINQGILDTCEKIKKMR